LKSPGDLKDFFLVGPLNFEKRLEDEIQRVQPWILGADGRPSPYGIQVAEVRKGGLDLRAPWLEGLQLVHHLKGPVRLLYRWKSKRISHVSELKSWIRGLRPLDLVPTDLALKIQSRKSRLQNEKMIERVFHEDWSMIRESSDQTLFVDVYDDQFTLSWDVNGESLYKRSWATRKGAAPLRENLAALLLEDLIEGLTGPELKQCRLVDPMMGSGTFLWEAASRFRLNTDRAFAYQSWKGVPSFLKTPWWKNQLAPSHMPFHSLWGFDRDENMVQVARENSKSFPDLLEGKTLFLAAQDVLKGPADAAPAASGLQTLLVSNPPYGERLAVKNLESLIQSAVSHHKPLRALFIRPRGPEIVIPGYQSQKIRNFLQGGLEVQADLFLRSC